jgi:hypothetical protein
MPPSPTGPLTPTVATDAGGGTVAWTTVSNAKVEDGAIASCGQIGPGAGGGTPNQLNVTSFGFNLPLAAIVDGIKLEIKVSTTDGGGGPGNDGFGGGGGIYLVYNGGNTAYTNTPNRSQSWPTTGLIWRTYGSSTSLWGKTWTGADINNANFGASMSAFPGHATSAINVDSARVTVYWHSPPHDIPQQMVPLYKVYDSIKGTYLGNLPNVTSQFALAQDINTGGAQITISCGVSSDTASRANSALTDEAGNILTDENSVNLSAESALQQVGIGTSGSLIRNGNTVQMTEYNRYYPNGKIMFSGVIERIESNFGGDTGDNDVKLTVYSDGSDMDNHLVRGSPFTYTGDVSQTSQNSTFVASYTADGDKFFGESSCGQSFTVGASVTNVGAISLLLNGTAYVSIAVYDSSAQTTYLGTTGQNVSVSTPTEIQFTLPLHATVTAGNSYFFIVTTGTNQSINVYYSNANPYANGQMYTDTVGNGNNYPLIGSDLYFKTFSTNGSTVATFTSVDPTNNMLKAILDDYNVEGGKIKYNSNTIDPSGYPLNYGFNTNTVYEGIQSVLSVASSGMYYYVDLGANLLYFKQANLTADIILTKGRHLNKLSVTTSIEYVVNAAYITGAVVAGNTIYTLDSDNTSIQSYGLRLQRHSDNNIPDTTAAHAVGSSMVTQHKNEGYLTNVTVPAYTMDITLLRPGLIIGFNGFGTFVDNLLAQIVHWDYTPDAVTLQLGLLPKRQTVAVEQVIRGLTALNTITNPISPS